MKPPPNTPLVDWAELPAVILIALALLVFAGTLVLQLTGAMPTPVH